MLEDNMFKYALVFLITTSTIMHSASNSKKVISAKKQYENACNLYKEQFGNPNKLFKFDPSDATQVTSKAELVLAGLKEFANASIETKSVEWSEKIMQLFSWADAIRLEATAGKDVHPDTFKLWESIRGLE